MIFFINILFRCEYNVPSTHTPGCFYNIPADKVRQNCIDVSRCSLTPTDEKYGDPCPAFSNHYLNITFECLDSESIAGIWNYFLCHVQQQKRDKPFVQSG